MLKQLEILRDEIEKVRNNPRLRQPVTPRRTEINNEKIFALWAEAEKNFRPILEVVNSRLAGGRGETCQRWHLGPSDRVFAGIKLFWDENQTAGRSLELGIVDGPMGQIYMGCGHNSLAIYSCLRNLDGSPNPNWQQETTDRIVEIVDKHPDWFEYT